MSESSDKLISELKQGDHVCSIYKTPEQQFLALISFFEKGLSKNEKYLYITDENLKKKIIDEFKKKNIDLKRLIKANQFIFLNAEESYFNEGVFDPDKMIVLVKNIIEEALKQGFSGIRSAGEMTWVLKNLKGHERIIEYEAKLNEFYEDTKITSLCQYNENKFKPSLLVEVIHTHPFIYFYGNLYKNKYYYNPTLFYDDKKQLLPSDSYEFIKNDIIEGD